MGLEVCTKNSARNVFMCFRVSLFTLQSSCSLSHEGAVLRSIMVVVHMFRIIKPMSTRLLRMSESGLTSLTQRVTLLLLV
jgi:hypothetical protein